MFRDLSRLVFPLQEQRDDHYRSDSARPCKNPNGSPEWSATFTGTVRNAWFGESCVPTAAVNQQPNPLKEREVEEAAMPGQAASARALPNALWQFTLENCQLPPASPQSSFDRLERSHVFAEHTFRQNVALRNRNSLGLCAEAVEGETSLWKIEENSAQTLAAK
jgi:hypothetical protein